MTKSRLQLETKDVADGKLHRRGTATGGLLVASWFKQALDHPAFFLARDVNLFLTGAKTDAAIERTRSTAGARVAFEEAYTTSADPWASASPRYRYQARKYEQIMALLPERRFKNTLDLGCGLGLLAQHLSTRSDRVLGVDLAESALGHARERAAGITNLHFAQGDVLDLSMELDGRFDLVVLADILYYLSPLSDGLLKALALRVAELLTLQGICVVANHFFFGADRDSQISRRIEDAFTWSPSFTLIDRHRKAFFLAAVLTRREAKSSSAI